MERLPKVISGKEEGWMGLPISIPFPVDEETLHIEGKWSKKDLQSLAILNNIDPRGDKARLVFFLRRRGVLDAEGKLIEKKPQKRKTKKAKPVQLPQTKRSLSDIVEENKRILRDNRDKFRRVFGVDLVKFMHHITGFDVVAFDSWLKVPDGESTEGFITRKYGKDITEWVRKELI